MNLKYLCAIFLILSFVFICTNMVKAQLEPPSEWFCNIERFNDGKFCDCGCGGVDIDCEDKSLPIRGCPCEGMTCKNNGFCEGSCDAMVANHFETISIVTIVNSILVGVALVLSGVIIVPACTEAGRKKKRDEHMKELIG